MHTPLQNPLNPKRKRKPVTIIVGIISKEGIVLASDSQTTYGLDLGKFKRCDAQKMDIIEFKTGKAIVCQGGNATLSGRAVELIINSARGKSISDYHAVADVAQAAVRQVKDEFKAQQSGSGSSMEELHEFIRTKDMEFSLMMANYFEQKPYIFTIDFSVGIANKQRGDYAVIGCGSLIAEYILSWFKCSELSLMQAMCTAVYVVEEVKKVDPYCGGPTRCAAILAEGADHANQQVTENIVKSLADFDLQLKSDWADKMRAVLYKAAEQLPPLQEAQKSG